ncbi:hypothetical protein Tco_0639917 [Tanacetum coccineum]
MTARNSLVVCMLIWAELDPSCSRILSACSMSHSGSCECFSYSCGNELVEHLSVNATVDVHIVLVGWDPLPPCGGGCPMTACYVAASDMSALQVRGSEFQPIGARQVYTVIRKGRCHTRFPRLLEAIIANH